MSKCSPGDIIKAVPYVQSFTLPARWFDDLKDDRSAFTSLYLWMSENNRIPQDDVPSLLNRTYVSEKVHNKLLAAEKKRLQKRLKLTGDKLDEAVGWSDLNTGPKTQLGGYPIGGDLILYVPESSKDALDDFTMKFMAKTRETRVSKIRRHAAGPTFYLWMLTQLDRPDRVGDFARDLNNEAEFPRDCTHFEEIKDYLDSVGASDAAIESFKQGWLEYAQQYPERIKPSAWCSECSQKLAVNDALLSWSTETQEIYILDSKCLNKYQRFDELTSRPLSTVTHSDLEDLVEKEELSEYDVERLTETLALWGVLPANCPGSVYFIQSEKTHAIKIGFTSGPIEKRLASLQTAHPYKLRLMTTLSGAVAYEKSLHERFTQFRLEGEWFEPHPDLIAFIATIGR